MQEFRKIDKNLLQIYYSYLLAHHWDRNHTCFTSNLESMDDVLEADAYGLYLKHKLIGYGTIMLIEENIFNDSPSERWLKNSIHFENHLKKAELALVIHPKYQHLGYGTVLLESLLEEASKNYDAAIAMIATTNESSISLVERQEFDFCSFCNSLIIFEKKFHQTENQKRKTIFSIGNEY